MAENDAQGEWTLPNGWVWTTLGEAYVIVLGQSPPSSTYNTEGVGLPFYQGKAEFGALYPTPVKWCSKPNKIAEAGDVLITVRAPVGPTNLCREHSCIGRGLSAIRPTDGMSSLYLLYYLRSIEQDWQGKATGTTFSAITRNVLRGQEVPLAPLPEQRRIVAEIETQFTRLDASIAALERAQANIRRYKAAVLKAACEGHLVPTEAELARAEGRTYEPADKLLARILAERRAKWEAQQWEKEIERTKKKAAQAKRKDAGLPARIRDLADAEWQDLPEEVYAKYLPKTDRWKEKYREPAPSDMENVPELPEGWVWATVEQVCDRIVDCLHGTPQFQDSGLICVDTNSIKPGKIVLEKVRYVDEATFIERNRRMKPRENDVLFSREGALLGIAVRVPANLEICLGQRMMVFRLSEAVSALYYETVLNSWGFRSQYPMC